MVGTAPQAAEKWWVNTVSRSERDSNRIPAVKGGRGVEDGILRPGDRTARCFLRFWFDGVCPSPAALLLTGADEVEEAADNTLFCAMGIG